MGQENWVCVSQTICTARDCHQWAKSECEESIEEDEDDFVGKRIRRISLFYLVQMLCFFCTLSSLGHYLNELNNLLNKIIMKLNISVEFLEIR